MPQHLSNFLLLLDSCQIWSAPTTNNIFDSIRKSKENLDGLLWALSLHVHISLNCICQLELLLWAEEIQKSSFSSFQRSPFTRWITSNNSCNMEVLHSNMAALQINIWHIWCEWMRKFLEYPLNFCKCKLLEQFHHHGNWRTTWENCPCVVNSKLSSRESVQWSSQVSHLRPSGDNSPLRRMILFNL